MFTDGTAERRPVPSGMAHAEHAAGLPGRRNPAEDHLEAARHAAAEGAIRLRVRYSECDPMNVAHHASYLPWLEMGRTELLRTSGVSYAQLEAAGVLLVVVKMELRYRRPAKYDDVLELRTRVVPGSRVKILHEYELVRVDDPNQPLGKADGESLFTASSTLGCVDRAGNIQPLPEWLVVR